jgi:hypothetical protein
MDDGTPASCLRSLVWAGVAGITLAFVLIFVVNFVAAVAHAHGWW